MMHKNEKRSTNQHSQGLTILYHDRTLAQLLDALDQLHNAASDNRLDMATRMTTEDLKGTLREIIYTAEETLAEIDAQHDHQSVPRKPYLRVLKKPSAQHRMTHPVRISFVSEAQGDNHARQS